MNADAILKRIEQDARQAADATLNEAKVRAEAVKASFEQKIAKADQDALKRAKEDAVAMDDRMQRMAELDARKALLAEKRAVLNEAFAAALKKLQQMPAAKAKQFGIRMLLEAARGDEIIVADEKSAWCDEAFVAEANKALAAAGKKDALKLSAEKKALGGGFLLLHEGMEINCSFPAALEARRPELEAEVAQLLFS